jgi:hypothetical protein
MPTEPVPPTEPPAPPSLALITVEEARQYLDVEKEAKPTDGLLEQIINGLSDTVLQRTGKTYINPVAEDGESTRAYEFLADEKKVHIDNVRAISKVEVTGTPQDDDSWLELSDTDWVAEPVGLSVQDKIRFLVNQELPAAGVGWSALALHRTGEQRDSMHTPWPWEARSSAQGRVYVRVTGKYGYGVDTTTVPGNVKLALALWLQNIHKRDQAFFSETIGVAKALTKMPPDVEVMLEGEEADQAQVSAV